MNWTSITQRTEQRRYWCSTTSSQNPERWQSKGGLEVQRFPMSQFLNYFRKIFNLASSLAWDTGSDFLESDSPSMMSSRLHGQQEHKGSIISEVSRKWKLFHFQLTQVNLIRGAVYPLRKRGWNRVPPPSASDRAKGPGSDFSASDLASMMSSTFRGRQEREDSNVPAVQHLEESIPNLQPLSGKRRTARTRRWPQARWAYRPVPLLPTQALEACTAMDKGRAHVYKRMNGALRVRLEMSPETCCRRFSLCWGPIRGEAGGTCSRLRGLCRCWIRPE
ncbi:uncharacterized protein LOC111947429 [Oryzias latipes]|uniref:uncharacterized protein LOC111947429 n=1 Tax=Oryzias latipes TaxID=8090 RepID=UPI000CE18E88|nr:uncharacterized protein LOC111947429 [Oryzias latipes]